MSKTGKAIAEEIMSSVAIEHIKAQIKVLEEMQKDLAYDPTSLMHRRVEEKLFCLRNLDIMAKP